MSKWFLPIALLFLLGLASGIGFSSSGPVMISGTGMSSSGSGMVSGTGMSSSGSGMVPGTGIASSGTGSFSRTGQYTPWQEGAREGFEIGFHMGQMYSMAQHGYNISGFNAEVDKYNAWVQQNFGNDKNLMMPKMQESGFGMPSYASQKPMHTIDASFNHTPVIYEEPLGWV